MLAVCGDSQLGVNLFYKITIDARKSWKMMATEQELKYPKYSSSGGMLCPTQWARGEGFCGRGLAGFEISIWGLGNADEVFRSSRIGRWSI